MSAKGRTSEGRFGWCLTGHHHLCRQVLTINGERKYCECSVCNHPKEK